MNLDTAEAHALRCRGHSWLVVWPVGASWQMNTQSCLSRPGSIAGEENWGSPKYSRNNRGKDILKLITILLYDSFFENISTVPLYLKVKIKINLFIRQYALLQHSNRVCQCSLMVLKNNYLARCEGKRL